MASLFFDGGVVNRGLVLSAGGWRVGLITLFGPDPGEEFCNSGGVFEGSVADRANDNDLIVTAVLVLPVLGIGGLRVKQR